MESVLLLMEDNMDGGESVVGVFRNQDELEAYYERYPWLRDHHDYDVKEWKLGEGNELYPPTWFNKETQTYWTWENGVKVDTGEKPGPLGRWTMSLTVNDMPFMSQMVHPEGAKIEWGFALPSSSS